MRRLRATNYRREKRPGFSLVELLVAVAVLLLLLIGLGSLFNYVSGAWTLGTGDIELHRGARSLADFIGMELRGAQIPVGVTSVGATSGPTTSTQSNLQMLVDPPASQVPAAYLNRDAIFFQAPFATETSYGDLAEIGYFVKWDQSVPTKPSALLCRYFVNPSKQTTGGTVGANSNYLIYDPSSQNSWLSQTLLDTVAPANSAQGYTGLFAENVVGFWVRIYGLDGVELSKPFDSRTGYSYTYQYYNATGALQTMTQQKYLPARATISLVQIDSQHAARLTPVWQQVQTLSQGAIDAADFMTKFQQAGSSNPALLPLLPGLHAYSTEVYLDNAR